MMAQMVKNLPAMQETRVGSLGWEDLLEKGMATHASMFAWRIPGTEEPGRLQSPGVAKSGDKTEQLTLSLFSFSCPFLEYLSIFCYFPPVLALTEQLLTQVARALPLTSCVISSKSLSFFKFPVLSFYPKVEDTSHLLRLERLNEKFFIPKSPSPQPPQGEIPEGREPLLRELSSPTGPCVREKSVIYHE